MARHKNDGKGRMGGRAKGTPNKATSTLKEWLSDLIDSNRDQMQKDLMALSPVERLRIFERLMGFIIPKATATQEQLSKYGIQDITNGELRIGYDDEDDWEYIVTPEGHFKFKKIDSDEIPRATDFTISPFGFEDMYEDDEKKLNGIT